MWTVMMVAMMIPSVSQVVLLYAGSVRRNGRESSVVRLTGMFVLGYLASWTGFSLLATLAQWGLHEAALLSPMMVSTSPLAGGAILIAAGYSMDAAQRLSQAHAPLGS
jgi:predicted metal-binding membrane protein